MSKGYEILSLDDLEPLEADRNGAQLMPLRHRLGFRPFGLNCWTAEAGKHVVPPHEEDSGDEELYVVVRGRATFTVDGETFDAPAGTLVHVKPGEHRAAIAEEGGTQIVVAGATEGKAFTPRGWDDTLVAFAHGKAGRIDEGRAIMQALPGDEQPWGKEYNLACYEARFGGRDEAFAHLDRAVRLSPDDARRWAERDTDLDSLREDPRFAETLG
jgi:mannose-6-phosphate isomerase-like protein (cupin superfamily)